MIHDDPRKLAKPMRELDKPASFKYGNKTQVTTGNENKKSLFNGSRPFDPCLELVLQERSKGKQKGKTPRVDPFMIRQAKLKAKQAE